MPRLRSGLTIAKLGLGCAFAFGCNTLLDNKVPNGDSSDAISSDAMMKGDGGVAEAGAASAGAGAGAVGSSGEGGSGGGGTSGETSDAGASGAAGSAVPIGGDPDLDAGEPPISRCPSGRTVCAPDTVQREGRVCGACDSGRQGRTRTCAADGCGYVEWSEWGECEKDQTRCTPDEKRTMARVVCGSMCGTAPVESVCSADCRWGEPVRGECTGEGVCVAGATRDVNTSTACGPCSKGTQVQHQTCDANCAWGKSSTTCALPSNVCAPEGYEGSQGWHCVGSGRREWCYVATESAALRCTWTGGRESYSGCP